MALKARLASLDGIAAEIAGEYSQQEDGSFVLSVEAVDGFGLENVGGLKSALQKERENAANLTKKLAGVGDLDAGNARAALDKIAEIEASGGASGKTQEALDALKSKLVGEHKAELATLGQRETMLTQQLTTSMVDNAAAKAIAEHGGSMELLMPIIRNSVSAKVGDDGVFSVRVLDNDGTTRITGRQGEMGAMGIAEYVGTLKALPVYAGAFSGNGASGAGTGTKDVSATGAREVRMISRDQMSEHMEGLMDGSVAVSD